MSTASSTVKTRLIGEIERLSEERLQEVADFVAVLLRKEGQTQEPEPEEHLDPTQDPLLQFIGGVSHGALAKDIDDELYGKGK